VASSAIPFLRAESGSAVSSASIPFIGRAQSVVEGQKIESSEPRYGAPIAHLRSVPADHVRDGQIAFLPPDSARTGTASEMGTAIGFLTDDAVSDAGRTDRTGLSFGAPSSVREGRMFDAQSVAGTEIGFLGAAPSRAASDIGFLGAAGGGGGGGGGINFMRDEDHASSRGGAAGPPSLLSFLGTDARGAPQSERGGGSSRAASSVAGASVAGSTAHGGKKRSSTQGGTARDEMSKRSNEKRNKKESKGRFNA